mgnify:CR=1 FL=1
MDKRFILLAFKTDSVRKNLWAARLMAHPNLKTKGNPVMNNSVHSNAGEIAGTAVGLALIALMLLFILALYPFFCFCNKRICEKCGVNPGLLIWIPILNLIPLFWAAQMSGWMILLMFIPIVGLIIYILLWVKICEVRGKGALGIILMVLLPVIGVPYLAFSE